MSLLLLLRPRASGGAQPQQPGIVELRGSVATALSLRGSCVSSLSLQGSEETAIAVRLPVGDALMAIEINITAEDKFFIGENKTLRFQLFESDGLTPKDATGMALLFAVRKRDTDPDPPLIQKTSGSGITVEGIFSADPALNTQWVVVLLDEADTATLKPRTYRHALKRTNVGAKTVLALGDVVLRQSTAH